MLKFDDLRDWISQAEDIGELVNIVGADTKYEIGAIDALTSKNQGPAVLFSEIKGYSPNFRVLTNLLSNIKTVNLTFGLPLDYTIRDTIEGLRGKMMEWEKTADNFAPRWVEKGPILDNVMKDDDIDLTIFPTPIWHELDAGPFIGTCDAQITRDPDTGHTNMGTYRCQLFDRHTVGMNVAPSHHGGIHQRKYFNRGEACPVVVLFGLDPLLFTISCNRIPEYIPELDYAGAIKEEPIQVIKGRVTGLPIPVNAEIAIEGFAEPNLTKKEGPFGEWTGHYAGGIMDMPFIRATTLYYRDAPILCGSSPSKADYSDEGFIRSIWRSALIYNLLDHAGVPDVKGVYCPPVGGSRNMDIISIRQRYDGHATEAGHVASAFSGRYTIVVDDDINPYDLNDVIWALTMRSRPIESDIIKRTRSSPTDPALRKPAPTFITSRQIIYAVKPFEQLKEFSPIDVPSEELRKEVFARWENVFKDRWQTI